uniref:Protein kinase domain-containing protein n=1 Tax=Arundo donax TaxID=35708 RepID=A0A0A9DGU5_ARUDO
MHHRRRWRAFSWEREGIGKLVFCGCVTEMYSMEELLRASAETLGRGEVGSTYKAVMETGFIVTVKRMRDPSAGGVGAAEFGRRAEELGRLRHPDPQRGGAQGLLPGQGGAAAGVRLLPQWQPLLPPARFTAVEKGEAAALDIVHEDRGGRSGGAAAPPPVALVPWWEWYRPRQPQALQRPPRPRLRVLPHRLRPRPNAAPLQRRAPRLLLHVPLLPGP